MKEEAREQIYMNITFLEMVVLVRFRSNGWYKAQGFILTSGSNTLEMCSLGVEEG